MENFVVKIRVDLVFFVDCATPAKAASSASKAARTLFASKASVATGKRQQTPGQIDWPTGSRTPEIATVSRADEDTFEVTIPASLRLPVEAEDEAGAVLHAGRRARRLADAYTPIDTASSPGARVVLCYPGEMRDLAALLPETDRVRLDVVPLSVERAATVD